MIILRLKNVIIECFWPLSKFHFPACSTLVMTYCKISSNSIIILDVVWSVYPLSCRIMINFAEIAWWQWIGRGFNGRIIKLAYSLHLKNMKSKMNESGWFTNCCFVMGSTWNASFFRRSKFTFQIVMLLSYKFGAISATVKRLHRQLYVLLIREKWFS